MNLILITLFGGSALLHWGQNQKTSFVLCKTKLFQYDHINHYMQTSLSIANVDSVLWSCEKTETVAPVVSGCPVSAPMHYLIRHNNRLKVLYYRLRYEFSLSGHHKEDVILLWFCSVKSVRMASVRFWGIYQCTPTAKSKQQAWHHLVFQRTSSEILVIELGCLFDSKVHVKTWREDF